ncbi:MAG: UDP-N-acetylglucosamine--N-acetylmuramyl-(pentapeptide) pyrophosphoryl-undecaprenol N-acetylglucosamine transferase [Candidatus Omnitrophica bacterium]|nr:UDP-N-acetylglucosamine--N-acetylmuramyl-(pentapeptide) pyrophosphoryl-undecaprenol N-acetylglucosamine transferase [Candidatus Omnitrophota bacterium]
MRKGSVFLFAGGSGGHVNPAIILKKKLDRACLESDLFVIGFPYVDPDISAKRLNISRFKSVALLQFPLIFLYIFFKALIKSMRVCVGFGGYHSLAGVLSAKILRAKTVIYEPNILLGKANRLVAGLTDKVFVIWHYIIGSRKNISGKIVRIKPLIDISSSSDAVKSGTFTVLFAGGSSGSRFLNTVFMQLIQNGRLNGLPMRLILITGKKMHQEVKEILANIPQPLNLEIEIFDFRYDMVELIKSSDLLVSRAGAQTIVEALYCHRPAIYIPYPYAQEHQFYNAQNIMMKKSGLLLRQDRAKSDVLAKLISVFRDNREFCNLMRDNIKNLCAELNSSKDAEDAVLE